MWFWATIALLCHCGSGFSYNTKCILYHFLNCICVWKSERGLYLLHFQSSLSFRSAAFVSNSFISFPLFFSLFFFLSQNLVFWHSVSFLYLKFMRIQLPFYCVVINASSIMCVPQFIFVQNACRWVIEILTNDFYSHLSILTFLWSNSNWIVVFLAFPRFP